MAGPHARKGDAAPPLALLSRGEIPLREVSGLAIGIGAAGPVIAAVGDHGPDVSFARLDAAQPGPDGVGAWESFDLSTLDAPAGTPPVRQAEAVAFDGGHQATVLIEDPALLLVVDVSARRITHAYELHASGFPDLDPSWAADGSSRGEGLVLLRDGHVLVVKEKRPAGLIEFGPDGARACGITAETLLPPDEPWPAPDAPALVALAWWPGDGRLADYSDAAVGPDGGLYLLSDQDNAIGDVRLPLVAGAVATTDRVWRLPDSITKAEGLAFLPDGTTVVAVDHRKRGRNLAYLSAVSPARA